MNHLGTKEFESICLERLVWEAKQGRGHFSRYGVKVSYLEKGKMIATPSMPDIEGALSPTGRQVIFDCKKVDSVSRLKLEGKSTKNQIKHMLARSEVGAVCFFMVHFNERILKTRVDAAATYAFPVFAEHIFWDIWIRCGGGSIERSDFESWGVPIRWNAPGQTKKERPDILHAVDEIARIMDERRNNSPEPKWLTQLKGTEAHG